MLLATILDELGNGASYSQRTLNQCIDRLDLFANAMDGSAEHTRNSRIFDDRYEVDLLRESGKLFYLTVIELDTEHDRIPQDTQKTPD